MATNHPTSNEINIQLNNRNCTIINVVDIDLTVFHWSENKKPNTSYARTHMKIDGKWKSFGIHTE